MSKLNINKTEWLELVFEGKNKAYGAYQLRQENGATTTKAFFSGLALVAGLASLPMILSSFTHNNIVPNHDGYLNDSTIVVTDIVLPNKEEPKKFEKQIEKADVIAPKTEDLNQNVVVVKKEEAKPTDFTENSDLGKKTSENPLALNGSPTGDPEGTTTKKTETPEKPIGNGSTVVTTAMAEKSPMYPGGIEEFLKLVGKRFQAPEMEEASTVRIIVMFIVEKDGTLSNIKVPKSAGEELDEEAIRVLKSIKTKWEPGIYEGAPVRTQYSLPIVVRTN